MLYEATRQCDVTLPGKGHPAARKRALFPGIVYDLPEECVGGLLEAGTVRAVASASAPAPTTKRGVKR